ncbi:MAG: hypothetical protein ACXVEI_06345 [Actinomycetota bacterium]
MTPKFGTLTKILAGVFAVAGSGAGSLAFGRDPGVDQVILSTLAIAYVVVAVGLWTEFPWAWWTGLALTVVTVVLDAALVRDGGWIPWAVFLVLFAITAIQGRRTQTGTASH